MIWKSRFVRLLLIAIVAVAFAAAALQHYSQVQRRREALAEAEKQRAATEDHAALRKAVEFLTPDTTSDIRFGKPKSPSAAKQPTAP